jgi:hypothetical protein
LHFGAFYGITVHVVLFCGISLNNVAFPVLLNIRFVATIDDRLKQEMELIHEVEERDAEEHDRTKPEWSNTVEMLLRKGVKAYKTGSIDRHKYTMENDFTSLRFSNCNKYGVRCFTISIQDHGRKNVLNLTTDLDMTGVGALGSFISATICQPLTELMPQTFKHGMEQVGILLTVHMAQCWTKPTE